MGRRDSCLGSIPDSEPRSVDREQTEPSRLICESIDDRRDILIKAVVMPDDRTGGAEMFESIGGVGFHVGGTVCSVDEDEIERATQRAPIQRRAVSKHLLNARGERVCLELTAQTLARRQIDALVWVSQ